MTITVIAIAVKTTTQKFTRKYFMIVGYMGSGRLPAVSTQSWHSATSILCLLKVPIVTRIQKEHKSLMLILRFSPSTCKLYTLFTTRICWYVDAEVHSEGLTLSQSDVSSWPIILHRLNYRYEYCECATVIIIFLPEELRKLCMKEFPDSQDALTWLRSNFYRTGVFYMLYLNFDDK